MMLVAQQRAVTLQGFTLDGRNTCNLMDDEQQNPPRLVMHTIWILIFEICDDSEPMLVKPGGRFNHVEPAGVSNERALALFVRDEFMLPTKIRYHRCKG